MPTREPIVNTLIPKEAPKPIPERVAVTRDPRAKQRTGVGSTVNAHQEITVETAPAAVSAPAAESVTLSPKDSALARKEQAFRQRELALKQSEESHAADLASAKEYAELKVKLSAKDFSAAEKLGMNYEEYTKYLLDKQAGDDPQAQKLKALEDEIQALKKGQEENIENQYEATVSEYRKELAAVVETKPEFLKVKKFEDVDSTGKTFTGLDVALQLILDTWEQDGEEVTVEQALADTELFIRERAKKMAALIEEPKPVEQERNLPPPKRGVSTLTNQMQPSGSEQKVEKPLHLFSEAERYAEARRRALAKRQPKGT